MMWFVREEFSMGSAFNGGCQTTAVLSPSLSSEIGGRRLFASSYIRLVTGKRVPSDFKGCRGDSRHNNFKVSSANALVVIHKDTDSHSCVAENSQFRDSSWFPRRESSQYHL
ncbi:hypothetical protein TNCV_3840071 [Trichonephila clavipes]|nr:hypothetical protein TNCV_3840071 [Trichonephila clavipes]